MGCLPPDQIQCLSGARHSCDCGVDECPDNRRTCYPAGDCPEAVRLAAGDRAVCLRPEPSDLRSVLERTDQCICGCEECLLRCDGFGPVFGPTTDDSWGLPDFVVPTVGVGAALPDRGRMGVYVRMRGLAYVVALLMRGDPAVPTSLEQLYYDGDPGQPALYTLSGPFSSEFVEHLWFDQSFIERSAYRWEDPSGKPELIAIATGDSAGGALFEIDCIVPFYVPD